MTKGSKKTWQIPAPLVWGLAISMIAIGLLAASGLFQAEDSGSDNGQPGGVAELDLSMPERAAESFLDAWRKRDHRSALTASVGQARELVRARQRRDESLTEDERAIKAQVWDMMAAARLGLLISSSEDLADGSIRLVGTAEGEFLAERYVREVNFVVAPEGERWMVREFEFGEILEGAELSRESP